MSRKYTDEQLENHRQEALKYFEEQKKTLKEELHPAVDTTIQQVKDKSYDELDNDMQQGELRNDFDKHVEQIVYFGQGKWRNKTRKVTKEEMETDEFVELLKKLEATLIVQNAFGLSAVQIGDDRDVMCFPKQGEDGSFSGMNFMINAEIIEKSKETWKFDEGCLTFTGVNFEGIERPRQITVRYLDVNGDEKEETYGVIAPELNNEDYVNKFLDKKFEVDDGWSIWHSRVIQHEVEHNQGQSILDHFGPVRRMLLQNKFMKRWNNAQKMLKKKGINI